MSECKHENKVYSKSLLTSKPPKRQWVCADCGAKGWDKITYPTNQISIIAPAYPANRGTHFGPGGLEYPMLERPYDLDEILGHYLRREA